MIHSILDFVYSLVVGWALMGPLFIPRIVDKWIGNMRERQLTGEYNSTLRKIYHTGISSTTNPSVYSPDNESGVPCREAGERSRDLWHGHSVRNNTNSWIHNPWNVGSNIFFKKILPIAHETQEKEIYTHDINKTERLGIVPKGTKSVSNEDKNYILARGDFVNKLQSLSESIET